jgi:hypothetical protein
MKDLLDKEINVGDTVVFAVGADRNPWLYKGNVVYVEEFKLIAHYSDGWYKIVRKRTITTSSQVIKI